jgi:hypothetical protein
VNDFGPAVLSGTFVALMPGSSGLGQTQASGLRDELARKEKNDEKAMDQNANDKH